MVEKLNRIKAIKQISDIGLLVFTPVEFAGIFGVSEKTASVFISRGLKNGMFIKLRNGFYSLSEPYIHPFFIANKLYQPSYVSLESALSYHGLIPETVYDITSVTTKSTREFSSPAGCFSYRTIKKDAFRGYGPAKIGGVVVFLAEPEKAVVDYLHFVDLKKQLLNERLDLKKLNKKKLFSFAKLFRSPSMLRLVEKIYDQSK